MNHFDLKNGVLHAEDVALPDIAAAVGTPVYIYSRATLERHAQVFRAGLSGLDNPHLAFAVKSNPNLAVLKVLARQGYGADVVSGGEMDRALAAGMAPEDIVFSGVGKTADGLDAIRWWREGKVLEIAKYCCFDVKVTRLVHEYGAANKKIFFNDRFGRKQSLDVDWTL